MLALAGLLLLAVNARAGEPAATAPPKDLPAESGLTSPPAERIKKDWNEYDLGWFTFRWGIYTLIDFANAAQDAAAAEQVKVERDAKVRDFRFTLGGKFKTERSITYTMGVMYDSPSNSWFARETGIQVAIPELWGNVFIGRQKEGVSLSRISIGYTGWAMERMPMSDATVPIMNDGIKWLGVSPDKHFNWNLAYFHNVLPKNPATGFYDDAVTARFAWVPLRKEEDGAFLHLGLGYHWGRYSDGTAQLRGRPESSTAPYFLDTGKFPAIMNHLFIPEVYFSKDGWLTGAEYFLNEVRSPEKGNPFFHGGEIFVSRFLTGESRPYLDIGGKLALPDAPFGSAFEGKGGAVELVLHFSYSDFDGGDLAGGKFWRLTPQLNWYIDRMVSVRINYGLGVLDRFGLTGVTHFFQARLQIQIG
jgi:phosphate-selective porin OprO/OprP